ncbi:MAG: hypothetical protein LBQ09_00520 [Acidobacteriaceae bacterium]|nr:hypothetical protein [Acidobacteriaceae bacterium]
MTDLTTLLQEFYADKLAELLRHIAGARLVGQYDANNAYQYIINREETQLSWVGRAIVDLDGSVPSAKEAGDRQVSGKGAAAAQTVMQEDAQRAQAFHERWQPKVEAMTNARHRGMLRIILGEVLEQKRFFEQARVGEMNLLGRRTPGVGERVGEVLPTRWLE